MLITIPDIPPDHICIVSVSGGKDSAAVLLALHEAGVPFRAVFADTGWEHPATYTHLDIIREHLNLQIDVVGVDGGMVGKIRQRAGFPARKQRWCTRELKINPLREYHDKLIDETGQDTISVMGIRSDESESRAKMPAYGFDDQWNGLCWRPILDWTVQDVIAIHRRHNLPMNPLYHLGHNRVGCYPCIYANKEEIRLVALHSPERINEIERLEFEAEAERKARNIAHAESGKEGLRYNRAIATFFQARDRKTMKPEHIRSVVAWSQTAHGGKQTLLFEPAPTGGCMRWGMCETAAKDGEQ